MYKEHFAEDESQGLQEHSEVTSNVCWNTKYWFSQLNAYCFALTTWRIETWAGHCYHHPTLFQTVISSSPKLSNWSACAYSWEQSCLDFSQTAPAAVGDRRVLICWLYASISVCIWASLAAHFSVSATHLFLPTACAHSRFITPCVYSLFIVSLVNQQSITTCLQMLQRQLWLGSSVG